MTLPLLSQAIAGLNGMQLGDKKLVVQRASVGAKSPLAMEVLQQQSTMTMPINIPGELKYIHCIVGEHSLYGIVVSLSTDGLEWGGEDQEVTTCMYIL